MAREGRSGLAAVLAMGLVAAGCSDGSDSGAASSTPAASPSASAGQSPAATGTAFGDGVDELRDGVWQIGEAGEVDFAVTDGALSLSGVRPAEGWQHQVSDDKDDDIEVHFTRGNARWKFEVEIDGSTMQIAKEVTLTGTDGGTYRVGSAGEVEVSPGRGDAAVTLGEVTSGEGWNATTREESSTDIEVEFVNGAGGKAEFELEARDDGIKVEISQKLTGARPT